MDFVTFAIRCPKNCQFFTVLDISQTNLHISMKKTTHQLEDLDDAWRCLEVPDVESDLEGLGVGARVRHHRHVGLCHRGGLGAAVVVVHHPRYLSEIVRHISVAQAVMKW